MTIRRAASAFICFILIFSLCSCGEFPGNTENVKITAVKSDIYTQEDIDSAIDTIIKEFQENWSGCILTEIHYAGDERIINETNYYLDGGWYGEDEIIVLMSTFESVSPGDDSGLNSPFTYSDWSWILVRNKGGTWRHVDHGYG